MGVHGRGYKLRTKIIFLQFALKQGMSNVSLLWVYLNVRNTHCTKLLAPPRT